MSIALSALGATIATCVALVLILILVRSVAVGVALVVALFCLDIALIGIPPLPFAINVFPMDILAICLTLAGGLRILYEPRLLRQPHVLGWLVFGAWIFTGLASGIHRVGTLAGVTARDPIYFWSCAFYCMTFRVSVNDFERLLRYLVLAGLALSVLCVARWALDAAGMGDYTKVGAGVPFRVEPSIAAQVISYAALVMYCANHQRRKASRSAIIGFTLGIVLVLQHRSVWLATMGAFLALLATGQRSRAKTALQYGLGAAIVVLGLITASKFRGGNHVVDAIDVAFSSGTDMDAGTTYARIGGWEQLLATWWNAGPLRVLAGFSYGRTTTREIIDPQSGDYIVEDFSAHNFYVESLYYFGILGTLVWIVVYARTLAAAIRSHVRGSEHVHGDVCLALLVSIAIYFIAYRAQAVHGIALGLVVGLLMNGGPIAQPEVGRGTS